MDPGLREMFNFWDGRPIFEDPHLMNAPDSLEAIALGAPYSIRVHLEAIRARHLVVP